jgi:hypothetical protein
MSSEDLSQMALELEAQGLSKDAEVLRQAALEIAEIEEPPGLFRRGWDSLRKTAGEQLGHLKGEVEESKELAGLLKRRIVPAGVLAAVNWSLPIPGTSWFTPLLLKHMGLLPSRWREAHALTILETEVEHLRSLGQAQQADSLDLLIHQLEAEADARDMIELDAALLSHWDENKNGVWDPNERAAYDGEVLKTRLRAASQAHRKLWFFQLHGNVMGPGRLSEFSRGDQEVPLDLLVCYEGSGWVAWHDLNPQESAL